MTDRHIEVVKVFVNDYVRGKYLELVNQLASKEDLIQECYVKLLSLEKRGYELNINFIQKVSKNTIVSHVSRKLRWFTHTRIKRTNPNQAVMIIPQKIGLSSWISSLERTRDTETERKNANLESYQRDFISNRPQEWNETKKEYVGNVKAEFWENYE